MKRLRMFIHVVKVKGKHRVSRRYEGLGEDCILEGTILFTIKQKDGEAITDLEKRVRKEARKRGINYVNNLG